MLIFHNSRFTGGFTSDERQIAQLLQELPFVAPYTENQVLS